MLLPPAPTTRIHQARTGQDLTLIKMVLELQMIKMVLELQPIRMVLELLLIRMAKAQMDSKMTIHFPSPLGHQNNRLMSDITEMRTKLKTSMILSSE